MMLKLDNNGQSFVYVAAFKQLGQKLHPYAYRYRSAISGEEVIDNAFGFLQVMRRALQRLPSLRKMVF